MPIVIGTVAVVVLGLWPEPLMNLMQGGAVAMLTDPIKSQGTVTQFTTPPANQRPATSTPAYTPDQLKRMRAQAKGVAPAGKSATAKKSAAPP